jgi:hypothetical protein
MTRLAPSERTVPMGLGEQGDATDRAPVQTVSLRSGDVIVLHTDGAIELRDPDGAPLDDGLRGHRAQTRRWRARSPGS